MLAYANANRTLSKDENDDYKSLVEMIRKSAKNQIKRPNNDREIEDAAQLGDLASV